MRCQSLFALDSSNTASEEVLSYLPPAAVDHSSANCKILASWIQSIDLFRKWYRWNVGCERMKVHSCGGRPWLLIMLLLLVSYKL
jgi:hypothetical protein